ncbi:hypothetical protein ACVGOW_17865 [Pseudonocardia saturnea]
MIRLAPGTYTGTFVALGAGTSSRPIVLCGPRTAVLTAGTTATGYSLHLDAARYWQVSGFTVRGGQKGVMADATRDSRVDGLLVEGTGDEALHLRPNSTDNVVSNNVIEGNDIATTRAESVDIKEGTTGGIPRNNRFNGTGMTDADSWVDVKGNGWTISGNVGTTASADGFQLHRILDGWGRDNVFSGNTATVNGPGYGVNLSTNTDRNRVTCTNRAYNAAKGLADVARR